MHKAAPELAKKEFSRQQQQKGEQQMSSLIDDYLLLTIYICCLCHRCELEKLTFQGSGPRTCECVSASPRLQAPFPPPPSPYLLLARAIEPDCRLKCRSRHTGRMRVGRAWIQGSRDSGMRQVAGGKGHIAWVWPLRAEHFVLPTRQSFFNILWHPENLGGYSTEADFLLPNNDISSQ